MFAWFNELIIIRSPLHTYTYTPPVHAAKKQVNLHYWHQHAWHIETRDIIWKKDVGRNLTLLINNWLNVLDEEKVIEKKITVQTALLSPSGHEAYISFDRNPLHKEVSIFEKWMLLEGMLKTIRANQIPVQQVRLLVHHQLLHDTHLDFSKAWPVHGFEQEA